MTSPALVLALPPRAECGHVAREAILVPDSMHRCTERLLCESCATVAANVGLDSALLAEALGQSVPGGLRERWRAVLRTVEVLR